MTIETLDRAIHATPFRPFSFMMADGRELPVPHRDFIAFNGKGRTAVITDESDGFDVVDLLLVSSLRFEGEPSSRKLEVS
jgi:hypothetical protein